LIRSDPTKMGLDLSFVLPTFGRRVAPVLVRSLSISTAKMETPVGVASTRVKLLTANKKDAEGGKCVVYWMNCAVRESYNYSLETAAACATNRKLPLLALYVLDTTYPDWHERHFLFAAQGLADVKKKLQARNIPFAVLHEDSAQSVADTVADVIDKVQAARLITDTPLPLHREKSSVEAVQVRCDDLSIPMVQVESSVVVPIEEVSEKEEYAARTIRPKIHRKWDDYFQRLPPAPVEYPMKEWPSSALESHNSWDLKLDSLPHPIDKRAAEVSKFFLGGYDAANAVLTDFVDNKLYNYSKGRNEPAGGFVSNLSPYLRYGHISPVECAIRARSKRRGGDKGTVEGIDAFIEEMVVRRELAYNMCHYNDKYDTMDCIPNFAKITLELHAEDKRPWDYTYEQLECAITHDAYWNAAQTELLCTGKMHGYMRMFWSKKILEWVATPALAFEYAIRLNNN